ncbi:BREX-1 system adenine-specific DNA-methyltransferase PglX [uncultured Phocaeicola sp.]|uniref:BREX-1 system adenine-specific DNA-methyltransferase PglX n=1 Tax=uncultured Phocaeicola sp. TaxID=990718 RepID=UPI002737CC37|nr:BREX-1 system adenine-specific DNA-methyltransferase PglX [uncultured Phocaeicola sp.]
METNAMDKNVLKKYAVWARRELIVRVGQRATFYGVTAEDYGDVSAESINGRILSDIEKKQRKALIAQIRKKGYEEVIEEVAYTWFNRFLALRFMEVNGYLPDRVKIFTDCDNRFQPQILNEAIDLEIDGLDMEKVYAYKDANQTEELYKYLLVVQCNALNAVLPGMFQKIEDYTELLLPDKLLLEGSVIERMIALIPEEDWKDAVQIIGWMYQYYNSEKKDEVFATLKKNVKITKENIPAATQLFTPDWIVRYMVENSLGRLWLEGHPNEELKADWIYYLEEAEQEPEVEAELVKIRAEYAQLTPEDIRCIDPCQGSGHILVYMFDVLMQIYESYGYTTQEAVASIVKNNIYGLDIDERAAQLSYFAVMMKACQYDKRFLKRKDEDGKPKVPQPRVYAIQESNDVDSHVLEYFCNGNAELKEVMGTIMEEMHDAKEYGSIITVTEQNWNVIYARFEEIKEDISIHKEGALELLPLVQVAQSLAQKYDVVVTNPPYMGGSGMSNILSTFVKRKFPNTKSDMSTIMMEHILDMCSKFGYMSMINIPVWMFLSSYEKMRNNILRNNMIINMVHPGRGIFGSDFGTTSFVISKQRIKKYIGRYYRLFDSQGEVHSIEERRRAFLDGRGLHLVQQDNFEKIPGMPIAYWLQRQIYEMYGSYKTMAEIAEPKVGMQTSNNDKYLRFWHEIRFDEFRGSSFGLKWIKYLKGGAYRKWYGNLEYLLFYNKTPDYILSQKNARVLDLEFLKKKKCTWTDLTISKNSFRIAPDDTFYDISGHCFFPKEKDQLWLLGYVNTSIFAELLKVFNSTIHCQVGDVGKIIVPNIESQKKKVSDLAEQNVNFSKVDWDSFETSWDFVGHPLTQGIIEDGLIMDKYKDWKTECDTRFNQLKANEEELNRIFIDIYGLQNEFSPEVDDKDVTIRKADLQRDIKSLISYAVGCMFGRYSIYKQGLIYAGGNFNEVYGDFPIEVININPNIAAHGTALYKYGAPIDTYEKVYLKDIEHMEDAEMFWGVTESNIIPITDDEYFADDIVGQFMDFIRIVYGEKSLEENLKFIADALGGKGQPREVIRNYFLNDFYKDHCKIYQKRPIYWLFDSGKKNGFKCLIYMHRYEPDTIARIRTDYVHEQQSRYRTAIADLEHRIANAGTSERVKLNKSLKKIQEQADELHTYEEKIHHLADQMIAIDLDDGVKHNYEIFKDVLAKIK